MKPDKGGGGLGWLFQLGAIWGVVDKIHSLPVDIIDKRCD